MPYKNAEERREKQRTHKRKVREQNRKDRPYIISLPQNEIINTTPIDNSPTTKKETGEDKPFIVSLSETKPKRPWTITLGNGLVMNLSITDDMPFTYI